MPFLHMATCDSPFQSLRSLHPPGGFLVEEPLKKPSPADFHRVHMQTLDTTAIALLSVDMHLTASVPPLTTLHQVGTTPWEPLATGLPGESHTWALHSSRQHMSCSLHSTSWSPCHMAWGKESGPSSLPLASKDGAENAQDTDNSLQRNPHFPISCQPQLLKMS